MAREAGMEGEHSTWDEQADPEFVENLQNAIAGSSSTAGFLDPKAMIGCLKKMPEKSEIAFRKL